MHFPWQSWVRLWPKKIPPSYILLGLVKVGGYSKLMDNYRTAGLPTGIAYQAYKDGCNASLFDNCTSCSEITPYYKNLFRPMTDSELPWPGLFGVLISGAWYWCTDQVIVQRALSAKNLSHVKASCILAGALKFLPIYLIVLPGMMARVLWPSILVTNTWTSATNPYTCHQIKLAALIPITVRKYVAVELAAPTWLIRIWLSS